MGIDVYELNRFDIIVENTLNINQVGMYTIQYYVTDLSNNQSVKVRYVHVMLPTKPNLVISDSVSTFLFGDEIQIPTCQVISHQVPCDVEYDQDTISLVGNHEIYFSFTYLGVKTTRIYYIFVLADTQSDEILYLPKKKDVYL
jgi:hypothetical protein